MVDLKTRKNSPNVPDANALVEAPRDDEVRLGVEVTTKCVVGVSLQRLEALARAQLPDLQGLVVAGRHQQPRVRAPRHVRDAEFVAGDGLLKLSVVCSPHLSMEIVTLQTRQM